MDGFAFGDKNCKSNAFYKSKTPNFDKILNKYPWTEIEASGKYVGLCDGQMGNSEVGHMTIGAGCVLVQDLPMIDRAIEKDRIKSMKPILNAIKNLKDSDKNIHIIGLYSSGGVHSHLKHIEHLTKIFDSNNVNVILHIVTDGRDVCPNKFTEEDVLHLMEFINSCKNVKIGTICGRYYAMDRDKRIERTCKFAKAIINGDCESFSTLESAIKNIKDLKESDEFINPKKISEYSGIKDGDFVLFANFRSDRMRQIAKVFTGELEIDVKIKMPKINLISMMEYYSGFSEKSEILFYKEKINSCISKKYSDLRLRQLKVAETEKYAHITFFFNGGEEEPFPLEDRILVPSSKVKTYDLKPEMSAFEIKDIVIENLKKKKHYLIVVNIANGDMIGHTGNFLAAKKAVSVIDQIIGDFVIESKNNDYSLVITADHGNIEEMIDRSNYIHTQHTLNKVPLILIDGKYKDAEVLKKCKSIKDIAELIYKISEIK